MNDELIKLLLKVMTTTFVLMAVIMLCCVVTPRLAKWIDDRRPPQPPDDGGKGEDAPDAPDAPDVRGPFDASHEEDYDLNYKIYNKDIYGVDFKNGKEKNG